MKSYRNNAIIQAQPMTRGDYCDRRGWDVPSDEVAEDEGYFITIDSDNVTWTTKHIFERDYSEIATFPVVTEVESQLSFSQMLEALKAGHQVSRAGWNGKGMFLYLVGAGRYPPSTPAGKRIAAQQVDGLVPYLPYIAMKTVTGEVVPWLASQTDILADDWVAIA